MKLLPIVLVVLLCGAAIVLMVRTTEALSGPGYEALGKAQAEAKAGIANYTKIPANTDEYAYGDFLDIMNTTFMNDTAPNLMPKISPGVYNSTSYIVPVGPYEVSFQLRSPIHDMHITYYTFNQN